jgi:hypothetical protein
MIEKCDLRHTADKTLSDRTSAESQVGPINRWQHDFYYSTGVSQPSRG